LALFATVVSKIGWSVALHELRRAWVALLILIAVSLVRLLLQTRSWQLALRAEGAQTKFAELVGIRLASQSLGYLSVLGPALSEPMKIRLLRNNWKTSMTATLVDSGTYWFSSVVVGIVGCVAASVILAHGRYGATLLAVATLFVLAGAALFRQKPILSCLVELSGQRAPQWLKKGAELEAQIRTFRERHPDALRSMMRLGLTCQVLLVAEAAVVISAAKIPLHLFTILGIEAAVRVAKMTGGWIPARIGADEGGAVAAFTAFGLSPAAGLMLALARRSRDFLWCALGLGWLAWRSYQGKREPISAEVA
jgi:hypothetical protein